MNGNGVGRIGADGRDKADGAITSLLAETHGVPLVGQVSDVSGDDRGRRGEVETGDFAGCSCKVLQTTVGTSERLRAIVLSHFDVPFSVGGAAADVERYFVTLRTRVHDYVLPVIKPANLGTADLTWSGDGKSVGDAIAD